VSARPALHWARAAPVPNDAPLEDLSFAERGRVQQLRDPGAKARFVAGCRLVRSAVGAALGVPPGDLVVIRDCPDCDRHHGRPRMAATAGGTLDLALARIDVSISHAGDWVALALCDGARVGVDIESEGAGEGLVGAVDLVLHPQERAVPVLATHALLRSWVRKEALLKASGDGLRLPPSGIVLGEPQLVAWDQRPDLVGHAPLSDVDAPDGVVAAIAVLSHGGVRHRSLRS
jgi:4'-phosphopantetheinyl transferase